MTKKTSFNFRQCGVFQWKVSINRSDFRMVVSFCARRKLKKLYKIKFETTRELRIEWLMSKIVWKIVQVYEGNGQKYNEFRDFRWSTRRYLCIWRNINTGKLVWGKRVRCSKGFEIPSYNPRPQREKKDEARWWKERVWRARGTGQRKRKVSRAEQRFECRNSPRMGNSL